MTAVECLAAAREAGERYQGAVNAFVDGFRRASPAGRTAMVREPIAASDRLEKLVTSVVSALCRELKMMTPK